MNLFENKRLAIFILSVGLLILIILLFFPNYLGKGAVPSIRESNELTQIKMQSKDTSLESIKDDLDKTDVENVDKELNGIEKEIDAAI